MSRTAGTREPTRHTTGNRTTTAMNQKRPSQKRSSFWPWLAFGVPILLIVAFVAFGSDGAKTTSGDVGTAATPFELPAIDGSTVSLDSILAEGEPALLYFSMGVGCDGCFFQIPEIADVMAKEGIRLVPIMVDPADRVQAEATRMGVATPILIDGSRSVSKAYGMLGVYGHVDRPSHSFALVDTDGTISWVRHYSSMFVPAADLLGEMPPA